MVCRVYRAYRVYRVYSVPGPPKCPSITVEFGVCILGLGWVAGLWLRV